MATETPPTKDELHFRKGSSVQSCANCLNWSPAKICTVLQQETLPTALCDAWTPVENEEPSGQPDVASMLFGNA